MKDDTHKAHRCVYGAARSIIKKNCAIGQSKFQLNLLAFLVRDYLTSVLGSLATHLEPILFKLLTAISSAWCRSVAVNEPPAPRRATS
jgi:hypothetical protein